MIIDDYLLYLHESKWKSLLRAGKLTQSQLRRIQQYRPGPDKFYVKYLLKHGDARGAQEYLAKKGIVKSARSWLDGVERGSKNILKKHNVDISYSIGSNRYKSNVSTDPSGKLTANFPSSIKRKEFGDATIIKRHETDEARIRLKQQKKTGLSNINLQPLSSKGRHASDEVLRRERELVNTSKSLYGKKVIPNKTGIADMRKKTGEYNNLGTKKEIKKLDKERLKQNYELNAERDSITKEIEELKIKEKNIMGKFKKAEEKLEEKYSKLKKELKSKKFESWDGESKEYDRIFYWYHKNLRKISDSKSYIRQKFTMKIEKLMQKSDSLKLKK